MSSKYMMNNQVYLEILILKMNDEYDEKSTR